MWEQDNAEQRGQVDSLARRVSALEGIRWGRGEMVYAAVMDMYWELHNISGGAAAAASFRDVLQGIAADGLSSPDDDLYDDSTPLPPKKPSQGVPECVAAQGLGRAGRVNLAHSLWRKCVPKNLRAIYKRATRAFRRGEAARDDVGQTPLSRMFESLHDVTHGVKPTSAPVSATAFLIPKSAKK